MTDGIVHHTSSCKKCLQIVLSVKTLFAFFKHIEHEITIPFAMVGRWIAGYFFL